MKSFRTVALAAAAALAVAGAAAAQSSAEPPFGMIGRIVAKPGQRTTLMALMVAGSNAMPGNLTFVVASDSVDADAIWISETWVNKAAHDASLRLPQVQAAIAQARPLIAAMGESHVVAPVLAPKS